MHCCLIFAQAVANGHEAAAHSGWRFDPVITLGDLAETFALPVTILIALYTLKKSARDQRELLLLREVIAQLNLLISIANEASQLVESNLRHPTADHKAQQAKTELLRKKLDSEVLIAEAFLADAEVMALKLAHKNWYDATFCESWPRTTKTGGLTPGDGEIAKLVEQRHAWFTHIIALKKNQVAKMNAL